MRQEQEKRVPTLTVPATAPEFSRAVRATMAAVEATFTDDPAMKQERWEELDELLTAGMKYREEHGIGKPMLDLKRKWKKVEEK